MGGWKVWGELRRRVHVELVWAVMRGQRGRLEDVGGGRRRITIDPRLDQCTRRAVLAHELVHDERGVLFTDDTPVAVIRKEEAWVSAETTRRLVPLEELDAHVRAAVLDDRCVGWREVVEWFDVPRDVAEASLAQLVTRASRRHPASG